MTVDDSNLTGAPKVSFMIEIWFILHCDTRIINMINMALLYYSINY